MNDSSRNIPDFVYDLDNIYDTTNTNTNNNYNYNKNEYGTITRTSCISRERILLPTLVYDEDADYAEPPDFVYDSDDGLFVPFSLFPL